MENVVVSTRSGLRRVGGRLAKVWESLPVQLEVSPPLQLPVTTARMVREVQVGACPGQ